MLEDNAMKRYNIAQETSNKEWGYFDTITEQVGDLCDHPHQL